VRASVELNGRNSEGTTRQRANATIGYDNLWQKYHSASISYQTAPEKPEEVKVFSGTYMMPASDADKWVFYGVHSESGSSAVGDISVIGNGDILGLRYVMPLNAGEGFFHSTIFGFDYKDFNEDIELQGADTLTTPISYLPFTAQYNATAFSDQAIHRGNIGLHVNIRGLANDELEFENKRFKAQANFMYVNGDYEYERSLPKDFVVVGKVGGQLTESPLISNEQYSLGGDSSIRGYFESQQLGDDAVFAGIELRTPNLASAVKKQVQNFYLLAFTEGGKLRVRDPLPDQEDNFILSSYGIGVRFEMLDHLNGSLDLANPLHASGSVEEDEKRVHFGVTLDF
jgi:hemolysin activation/secretion protein